MTEEAEAPECCHPETRIKESRWVETKAGWLGVRRRRQCRECGAEFRTIEIPMIEYFPENTELNELSLKKFETRPRSE